jgi:hypothetical protein
VAITGPIVVGVPVDEYAYCGTANINTYDHISDEGSLVDDALIGVSGRRFHYVGVTWVE